MSLTFREAQETDIPAIVALLTDDVLGATREVDDIAHYVAAFKRMAEQGGNTVILALLDDAIVGTYQFITIEGLSLTAMKRAQIESVRIASHLRGRGYGAKLMADAKRRAVAQGCGMVQLMTNQTRKDTHRFYERLGYRQSHFGYKLML